MNHAATKAVPVVFLLLLLSVAAAAFLPSGVDWTTALRPAALDIGRGRSPYEHLSFLNPPWTGALLLPIAVLPEQLGRGVLFAVSLAAFGLVLIRLGARPLAFGAFLASPPVMHGLLNANIDWLVPLALLVPPRWGLFLATCKPQAGIGLALYWAVEAWRQGGWREVVRVFWPITVVTLATFAYYGFWPLKMGSMPELWWNASLWPYAVPVGIALFWLAVRRRDERIALAASPWFAPYVLFHTYAVELLPLARRPRWMVGATLALWGLVILRLVL